MDVMDAILSRKSVKQYLRNKIPHDALLSILDAARWAPAAGNLQNIRMVVVEESADKRVLAKASAQEFVADAPVVLIVGSDNRGLKKEFGDRGADLYAKQNVAAAIQNMLLAAEGFGIGSCWVGAFAEAKIRSTFQIKDFIEIHALIMLGYPAHKLAHQNKLSAYELVSWGRFGNSQLKGSPWPTMPAEPLVTKLQKLHAKLKEEIGARKKK